MLPIISSKLKIRVIIVFFLVGFCISVSASQSRDIADLDLQNLLDNVVLSASKHEETLAEAPSNVFIVTRAMIESYGCMNIAEALSLVPGIYITDDYSLAQIGVRGISSFGDWNTRVMLLVDGKPVVEQYGGTSSIDVVGLRIDNIDRIEVIKGPSSSLYGSNAFFGIINLITFRPHDNEFATSSKYFSDTDLKAASLRFSRRFNKDLNVYAAGTILDQNGNKLFFSEFSDYNDASLFALDDEGYNQFYEDSSDFTGGISRKRNTLDNYAAYGRIEWRNFHLTFNSSRQKTGIAHSFYGSLFNRPENQYREQHHIFDLGFTKYLTDQMELSTLLSYNYYTWSDYILYNYYSEEDTPDYLPGPIWIDDEFNNAYCFETKLYWDFNSNNTIIAGAEVQLHNIRHESGESDAGSEEILENVIPDENVEYNGQIYNLYAQYEHRFSGKLKTIGGLHFNYYSYTTGRVMPKWALIFQPYKQGTYKAIVSRGFRSPTFYEITFDDGYCFIGNPELKPELITSYELISTHEFPYGFTLEVAANHSRMQDIILQSVIDVSDPAYPGGDYLEEVSQFKNTGKMNSKSLEISIQRNPIYSVSGFANITYQKLDIQDNEDCCNPFNSPHWLGNAGLTYQIIRQKLSASSKINYISSRYLWDGSSIKGQATIDLHMNIRNIFGFADLAVGIKNILDEDYRIPLSYDYAPSTSIERPGRSLFLNVRTSVGM